MKSIRLFALVLAMFILSGCGKEELENKNIETSVVNEAKMENVEETKQETKQETEVEVTSETNVIAQTKEEITEASVAVESETVSEEEIIDPNFNGAGYKGTLEETVQSYITYEDIEPTTMYVISNNTGEQYSTYHDINVTDGELVVSGMAEPNQEIIIDGKGIFNNIEYYRIAFQEAMMLNHQIIIPAECLSAEKQEAQKPVEQQPEVQKPVEQQPEVQQPTQQEQPSTSDYDPSLGISESDWNELFGGGPSNGGHTWTPDGPSDAVYDDNNRVISGSGAEDPSKIGSLTFH